MNLFFAIILGTIQGITEFLPISSSAHLVIVQHMLPGFSQPGILFDVILHAGTLIAVIYYFREKLLKISAKMLLLLFVGTLPAVILGFLFQDFFEASFSDVKAVGFQLIISGILAFFVDKFAGKRTNIKFFDALLIGLGQAIAIIPGISRSGTTIFAGVARGINKSQVAEYSFLLSIPAILGAIVLQVSKYGFSENIDLGVYGAGFVASFVFGILSIKILLQFLMTKNFKVFSFYCFIVGLLVLAL